MNLKIYTLTLRETAPKKVIPQKSHSAVFIANKLIDCCFSWNVESSSATNVFIVINKTVTIKMKWTLL